jgi:hypothetical protein
MGSFYTPSPSRSDMHFALSTFCDFKPIGGSKTRQQSVFFDRIDPIRASGSAVLSVGNRRTMELDDTRESAA